jgi:hypothetical protein
MCARKAPSVGKTHSPRWAEWLRWRPGPTVRRSPRCAATMAPSSVWPERVTAARLKTVSVTPSAAGQCPVTALVPARWQAIPHPRWSAPPGPQAGSRGIAQLAVPGRPGRTRRVHRIRSLTRSTVWSRNTSTPTLTPNRHDVTATSEPARRSGAPVITGTPALNEGQARRLAKYQIHANTLSPISWILIRCRYPVPEGNADRVSEVRPCG